MECAAARRATAANVSGTADGRAANRRERPARAWAARLLIRGWSTHQLITRAERSGFGPLPRSAHRRGSGARPSGDSGRVRR